MIEIIWEYTALCIEEVEWNTGSLGDALYKSILVYATVCMEWLLTEISKSDEPIELNRYILGKDKNIDGCSAHLICADDKSQERIFKILQNPPDEFKEKYIAHILYNEPDPNHKQNEEKSETEKKEIDK